MGKVTIWHNPRCSKSRQTLQLLRDRGHEIETVEYLKNPPSVEEITEVLKALDLKPGELIRKGEAVFREEGIDQIEDDEELIAAMNRFPILIERPIVMKDGNAAIGRPPVNVLKVL